MSVCPDCKGKGFIWVEALVNGEYQEVKETCDTCDGEGENDNSHQACGGSSGGFPPFRCTICRGTGVRRS